MPIVTLQCEDRVLKKYAIGPMVTIGRLSDNTMVIDSPAVSSHHACIFRDGDNFVVEDLQSTNGTFVNEKRVVREALHHGDVVMVGKHRLVFDKLAGDELAAHEDEVTVPSQGETVYLNPQEHQRLMTVVMNAEARAGTTPGATSAPAKLGALRVVAGRADQPEYILKSHTSLIGRASWTLIRLKGWFKPGVAVAITRNQTGYVATLLRGKMLINSQPMNGRYDLKDGDILEVGGLTLAFGLTDENAYQRPETAA